MAILGVDADPNVTGNGGLTPLHGKAPPASHQAAPWFWQCRLLSSADHHETAHRRAGKTKRPLLTRGRRLFFQRRLGWAIGV